MIGLILTCILSSRRKPQKFLFEHFDHKMKLNGYIRLCFEHSILFIIKILRRKRSERKSAIKNQKVINGNRKTLDLKILSWNSGHTFLVNQINEVRWLIQEKSPHILFISESNLKRSHDKELLEIEGYRLHTTKVIGCPDKQVSRIVAYVKDGIIVRRRGDLESEDVSAIWMEAGLVYQEKRNIYYAGFIANGPILDQMTA